MYTITEIEDAIIAYLKSSTVGEYCKKIDSFQIESGDIEEQIKLFALQMPCALIVFSEGAITRFPGKRIEMEMRFQILLAAESLRGKGASRRGAAGSTGTYKMIYDLVFGASALTGQRLGLNINPIFPTRIAAEINAKGFSAYSVEFETKIASTYPSEWGLGEGYLGGQKI